MDDRLTGTLKNKDQKGFGFISREDGEPDVFIHRSAFDKPRDWDSLSEGTKLQFAIEDRGKGPRAKDVELVG